MLEKLHNEWDLLHPTVKTTLCKLEIAIDEINRQIKNPPVSPMSYTEQIFILRYLRHSVMMYRSDLIANKLTEEQKLEIEDEMFIRCCTKDCDEAHISSKLAEIRKALAQIEIWLKK